MSKHTDTTLEDLDFADNIVILYPDITIAIRYVTVLRENGTTVGPNKNFHKTKAMFICCKSEIMNVKDQSTEYRFDLCYLASVMASFLDDL